MVFSEISRNGEEREWKREREREQEKQENKKIVLSPNLGDGKFKASWH